MEQPNKVYLFNKIFCISDISDASGNISPPGYLWLRRVIANSGKKVKMEVGDVFMDNTVQTEPIAEVIGLVNIFNGKLFNTSELENIIKYTPFETDSDIVYYYTVKFEQAGFWKFVKTFLFGKKK